MPLGIGTVLFGSTAPYVSTWLTATTHRPLAPGFYLLAAAATGTLAAILGLPGRDVIESDRAPGVARDGSL